LNNSPSSLISSLGNLTKELYNVESIESMMDLLAKEMERLFGFSAVWLYQYVDNRKATIQLVSAAGEKSQKIKDLVSTVDISDDQLCEDVFTNIKPVYIKDVREDARANQQIVTIMENRSMIQSQLFLHGESTGSLGSGSFSQENIVDLSDDEIVYFGAISNAVSITLDRMRYREKSLFDTLTGLQNKRGFEINADLIFRTDSQNEKNIAVLYFDLDNFKPLNDTYGHSFGDEILKLFANSLENALRHIDVKARIGGDEFIVILPNIVARDNVERVIKKIKNECAKTDRIQNINVNLGFSYGYSVAPSDGTELSKLIDLADQRMYQNKKSKSTAKHR
jgi:diguanylate cyclase (GGDEF)-like protein